MLSDNPRTPLQTAAAPSGSTGLAVGGSTAVKLPPVPTAPPTRRPEPALNPAQRLEAVTAALDAGQCRRAFETARPLGDPRSWRGALGRTVAARLATHCGAPRLGNVLALLAEREHPADPKACLSALHQKIYGGPAQAWQLLHEKAPHFTHADVRDQAEWWTLRTILAAQVRDFADAEQSIDKALHLSRFPWIQLQKARLLEMQDRIADAETAVDGLLEAFPWYRPAVQHKCHLRRLQGDDDGALQLLFTACRHLDAGTLELQLGQSQMDLEMWADAEESLDRFEARSPLLALDRHMQRALWALRGNIAYRLGRLSRAADFYERAAGRQGPGEWVKRLRDPALVDRRVVLDVPWVRQNHNTCGPATLTSLCRYWRHPAQHLDVVEAICYGGTRAHSERRWARENGLFARELTVTWEVAQQLIDRGVPFAFVTADTVNAHLQAVVGYDLRRGTLICRDPSSRGLTELDAEKCLTALAGYGPRGMVLLPPTETHRLDGLELPEWQLYELYDRVEAFLELHKRQEAGEARRALQAQAPGHRLAWVADRAMAAYDHDTPRHLRAVDALIALFPDDQRLHLERLSCLAELERPAERLAELRTWAERRDADPIFTTLLASELIHDARAADEVRDLLRRAAKWRGEQAVVYELMGRHEWRYWETEQDTKMRRRALTYFRWAACLGETQEERQLMYLSACRWMDREQEALGLLWERFQRLGGKSAAPALTLISALENLDRFEDAGKILAQALERRPKDGDLWFRKAEIEADRGRIAEARQLTDRLDGHVAPAALLSFRAQLAEQEGDLPAAVEHLQKLVDGDPLNARHHARLARLTSMTQGHDAALEAVRRATSRFPFHRGLAELEVGLSWDGGTAVVIPVLQRMLADDPDNAWAQREIAGAFIQEHRLDEAGRALDLAARLEPDSPAQDNVRGQWLEAMQRHAEADGLYRSSIEKDPDNVWALGRLLSNNRPAGERRELLRWAASHVNRSRTDQSLPIFADQARRYLPPDEVLDLLRRLHGAKPESSERTGTLAEQLISMDRAAEAQPLLAQALARWPFTPGLWMTSAEAHRVAGDGEAEQDAVRRAVQLDPTNTDARCRLAGLALERGDTEQARRHIENGRARAPYDPALLYLASQIEWQAGRRDEAIDLLERIIEHHPEHRSAWTTLHNLGGSVGRDDVALDKARQLTEKDPKDVYAWSLLAELARDPAEAMAAVDRALVEAPQATSLHLQRSNLFLMAGDPEQALEACRPAVFGDGRPTELVAREAEILWAGDDRDGAVERIREAVQDDPGYVDGWSTLTDWLVESERFDEAASACDRWLALVPHHAVAWAYRADLKVRDEAAVDDAVEDFRRAAALDPRYAYPALRLSQIEEERGRPADGLAAVAPLVERQGIDAPVSRAVELAAKAGEQTELPRWIELLGQCDSLSGGELIAAIQALETHCPEHLQLWDEVSFRPETRSMMAECRAYALATNHSVDRAWEHLERLQNDDKTWGDCAALVLGIEGENDPAAALERLPRFRAAFQRATATWGKVGWLYIQTCQWQACADWLKDFPSRRDHGLEPWMLVNLALAQRYLELDSESGEVSRWASEHLQDPDDSDSDAFHELNAALMEALDGDLGAAQSRATDPDSQETEWLTFHARLLEALRLTHGRSGDGDAFRQARQLLKKPSLGSLGSPLHVRAFNRTVAQVARNIGGPWAWLWRLLSHQLG